MKTFEELNEILIGYDWEKNLSKPTRGMDQTLRINVYTGEIRIEESRTGDYELFSDDEDYIDVAKYTYEDFEKDSTGENFETVLNWHQFNNDLEMFITEFIKQEDGVKMIEQINEGGD